MKFCVQGSTMTYFWDLFWKNISSRYFSQVVVQQANAIGWFIGATSNGNRENIRMIQLMHKIYLHCECIASCSDTRN